LRRLSSVGSQMDEVAGIGACDLSLSQVVIAIAHPISTSEAVSLTTLGDLLAIIPADNDPQRALPTLTARRQSRLSRDKNNWTRCYSEPFNL